MTPLLPEPARLAAHVWIDMMSAMLADGQLDTTASDLAAERFSDVDAFEMIIDADGDVTAIEMTPLIGSAQVLLLTLARRLAEATDISVDDVLTELRAVADAEE